MERRKTPPIVLTSTTLVVPLESGNNIIIRARGQAPGVVLASGTQTNWPTERSGSLLATFSFALRFHLFQNKRIIAFIFSHLHLMLLT